MITYIHVRARSARETTGFIICGERRFPCIIGRAGRRFQKREGDGASPIGVWQLGKLFFRSDRVAVPRSGLRPRKISPFAGWCDDQNSMHYNRAVKLPYGANHEEMFREDCAYDLVVTTDHNQRPRIKGHGSAIFFHLMRPDSKVTAGCVAVSEHDMRLILAECGPKTKLVIWPAIGDLRLGFQK